MDGKQFLGLRTVIYVAPDLAGATAWYAKAFETEPYFNEPFYVGFTVGGFELGLIPDGAVVEGSTITYWGVAILDEAWERIIGLGATPHTHPQDVGDGIRTAAVRDPFGNVIGLIENPHFGK